MSIHVNGDLTEKINLGTRLHDLIVDSAGNDRLKRLVDVLKTQILFIQSYATKIPGRTEKSFEEHIEIIDAILEKKDGVRAEAAMRHHLENTMNEMLNVSNLPLLANFRR